MPTLQRFHRPTRRRRHALVAAARPTQSRVDTSTLEPNSERKAKPDARVRAWQAEAFDAWEGIGELHYAIGKKAEVVARGAFVVMEPADDDTDTGDDTARASIDGSRVPTDNAAVLAVMDAFRPPPGTPGGRDGLIRRVAQHLEIVGESFLIGEPLSAKARKATDLTHGWEFLSPEEYSTDGEGSKPKRRFGGVRPDIDLDLSGYSARLWRPDARFSDRPDCALRSALNICRQVRLLTDLVDAAAETKLSAKILLLPDEIDLRARGNVTDTEGYDDDEAADDPDGLNKFLRDLIAHLTTPIKDNRSAARWAPIILRAPADLIDKITTLDIGRDLDNFAADLRAEALRRLARSLDLPAETMEGVGDATHWNAYAISGDFLNNHIIPLGDLIAEFLTDSYLRPRLMAAKSEGGLGLPAAEAMRYTVVYDPSALSERQDEGPTFRELHAARLVSDEAARRANGAGSEDAPDEEEAARRFLESLIPVAPKAVIPKLAELYGIDWTDEDTAAIGGEAPAAEPPPPAEEPPPPAEEPQPAKADPKAKAATGDDANDEPEQPAVDETTDADTAAPRRRTKTTKPVTASAAPDTAQLIERLTTAGHDAVERALERASARIANLARRQPTLKARLEHVATLEVPSAVTASELAAIGTSVDDLLDDAWIRLALAARPWISSWLEASGEEPIAADEQAAWIAQAFCDRLDAVARTAFARPLPLGRNGLRIDYGLAADTITAAAAVPA